MLNKAREKGLSKTFGFKKTLLARNKSKKTCKIKNNVVLLNSFYAGRKDLETRISKKKKALKFTNSNKEQKPEKELSLGSRLTRDPEPTHLPWKCLCKAKLYSKIATDMPEMKDPQQILLAPYRKVQAWKNLVRF
ncbi:5267_t:CDS:2 [Dentiscutata erythropus]|uniref:5267_t:CDS:1 n=1 Tax=Dentiscutata erythropus TaxID=1348616 RepID=A0A9N9IFT5_9GLOM|nr:5267_t:CDS:2 [Dentiscutata erythropus]